MLDTKNSVAATTEQIKINNINLNYFDLEINERNVLEELLKPIGGTK